jgi:hypothetical protein
MSTLVTAPAMSTLGNGPNLQLLAKDNHEKEGRTIVRASALKPPGPGSSLDLAHLWTVSMCCAMFFMVATSFTSNSVVHAIAVSPRPITQRSRAVAKTSSPDPRVADQGKILVNIQATLTRIEATQAAQGATQAAQGVTLTSTRNWVVSAVVSLPFAPVYAPLS